MEAPDVIGLEVPEAHRYLRPMGLRLAASVWETKVGPWGRVLSQRPAPGSGVRPGSLIEVVFAGRPHSVVPNVSGLEAELALDALRRSGFVPVLARTRASRSVPYGHVIRTQPGPGRLVVDGAFVLVDISAARPLQRDASGDEASAERGDRRSERGSGS